MLCLLSTAALLALVRAEDCPVVDLVPNFDLNSYAQGIWYEIARYNNIMETAGNCVTANYTNLGNNEYVIEVIEVEDGRRKGYDGLLDLSTQDHLKSILTYEFVRDGQPNYKIQISFLAVDYTSYAVKYACFPDPKTRNKVEIAWILSRTKQLSPSVRAKVDNVVSSTKILDKDRFFWDDFSDVSCKYSDTNIHKALPKRLAV